eukprot:3396368-Pyramimonas_sp.AAC.1
MRRPSEARRSPTNAPDVPGKTSAGPTRPRWTRDSDMRWSACWLITPASTVRSCVCVGADAATRLQRLCRRSITNASKTISDSLQRGMGVERKKSNKGNGGGT